MKIDSSLRRYVMTPIKHCVFAGDYFMTALIHPLSLWICAID